MNHEFLILWLVTQYFKDVLSTRASLRSHLQQRASGESPAAGQAWDPDPQGEAQHGQSVIFWIEQENKSMWLLALLICCTPYIRNMALSAFEGPVCASSDKIADCIQLNIKQYNMYSKGPILSMVWELIWLYWYQCHHRSNFYLTFTFFLSFYSKKERKKVPLATVPVPITLSNGTSGTCVWFVCFGLLWKHDGRTRWIFRHTSEHYIPFLLCSVNESPWISHTHTLDLLSNKNMHVTTVVTINCYDRWSSLFLSVLLF